MKDYFNVEFSDDRTVLVKAPQELSGGYVIPEGVTTIGANAFRGCASLNKLTIPRSLKSVSANAFLDCKALTTLLYEGDLLGWLGIRWGSWIECSHRLFFKDDISYRLVSSVVIPESITDIPALCFCYCKGLTNVVFHDGVKSIGDSAFNKSDLAGEITLPPNLEKIGNYAFLSCKQLVGVFIPDAVKTIGNGCFAYCDKLMWLTVDSENSLFMSDPQSHAIFDKFQTRLIACVADGGPELKLSKTCQTVQELAFAGCNIEKIYLQNITSTVAGFNSCKSTFIVPAGTKAHYIKMGFPESQISEECNVDELFKKGKLDIIENNPFRVLGVCANDSARSIASNATKIKRYSDVGKSVSFPLDDMLSSHIDRSSESVDNALSVINLQSDKIKHALFWFGRPESEDNYIFKALLNKTWKGLPTNFLQDEHSYPDSLNIALFRLLQKDKVGFIIEILRSTQSESFRDSFLKQICDDDDLLTAEELNHIVLDTLLTECDARQLYAMLRTSYHFDNEEQYVKNKVVGDYTSSIYAEIQRAKKVDDDDADANFVAAQSLIKKTKEPLSRIEDFLGSSDSQYMVIADALSKQILQSGINYFNSSDDEDAPYKAFEIQSYATDLAKGKLIKQRCEENIDILKKIIKALPPKYMRDFDRRLHEFIDTFEDVYSISGNLDNIENALNGYGAFSPEIQEFDKSQTSDEEKNHIKEYVARASTGFAEAVLSELIDTFNRSMKTADIFDRVGLYGGRLDRKKSLVSQAWQIITMLGCVPMEQEYKTQRYQPNRDTLGKMYDDFVLGIPQTSFGVSRFNSNRRPITNIDMRSEKEVFEACRLGRSYCDEYLKRHPQGKYKKEVYSLIDDYDWAGCKTISSYRSYVKKYKYGNHTKEAQLKLDDYDRRDLAAWNACSDLKSYEKYIADFPEGAHRKEAEEKRDSIKSRITTFQVIGGIVITGVLIALIAL